MSLLSIKDLNVTFSTPDGDVNAVNGLNVELEESQTLAIVGESGSGKSQTAFAIMGLLAPNARTSGEVMYKDQNLLTLSENELNTIRAREIGMIFQDPMTSLNPYMKISDQLSEVLMLHKGLTKKQAIEESIHMLDAVRIPEARSRIHMYPHEFSGGMRQRVMIAMSLLCRPKILIADEPTTALDVTVQAQIMKMLQELQYDFGTAIILITHDLGVVAGACEKTLVMYGGTTMEYGQTNDVFKTPSHPYTKGLLHAVPRLDHAGDRLNTIAGNPPNMLDKPDGCPFAPRCDKVSDNCHKESPILQPFGNQRERACFKDVEEI